jgi:epoxyqueuosine reductase
VATLESPQFALKLKQEAHRLGFQLVGITSAEPPKHLDVFQAWIDAGHHGEMKYMEQIERRSDPRAILPDCQSIVALGTHYRPANLTTKGAQVASYALGDDYHDLLNQRAAGLVSYLEAEVGHSIAHRIYTDTGPILERELAQRAGLGWIGKNTCLINPAEGSYFVLTELLLGLELARDEPFVSDQCGSCRRCIEACPTKCIREDRTLDASRCISYLTIELRGSIPAELRSAIGEWMFGCDICQDVCPWNLRFAAASEDAAFQPRRFLQSPDPVKFLELDPPSYQEHLRASPLKRPKIEGLRRNAAVVAGNMELQSAVDALIALLTERGSTVERSHAAWALGKIEGAQALSALEVARPDEADPDVLAAIDRALQT